MCLKTLSGKYLAPKLISLFDQKKATEKSELKKLKGCKTLALVKTQETNNTAVNDKHTTSSTIHH